jgi:glycosyltransferase involved in cell wall biosynthesis
VYVSPPKIAVLCAIPDLGGAEISLLELVARLGDRYEFHLMVPAEGALKSRAEQAGARVRILPWPAALMRTGETSRRPSAAQLLRSAFSIKPFVRQLSTMLRDIQPSAFITNASKAHILGALASRPKGVPLIWYMRDGLEHRPFSRKLLSLLSRRCDFTICISHYVADQVRRHVSNALPTNIVYNIIDLNAFHPGSPAPADLSKGKDEIWFGIIGPITPLKGHDIFLDAAEKVAKRLSNAVFVIVGMNPYATQAGTEYEDHLRRRVASSSIRDRVKFLGYRKDIPNVLSRLDALVQPNRGPEGLGRSVLEAMACGVPVVTVNRWGPAEVVQDGRSGLLFPPLDSNALAARMIALGEDLSLRASLGRNAHEWIRQNIVPIDLAGHFDRILKDSIASSMKEAVSV